MLLARGGLIRAICRFAKIKAVALMQIAGQKQNASGWFRYWAAYQLIRPERNEHGFHPQD
jgi:hypothetical protein